MKNLNISSLPNIFSNILHFIVSEKIAGILLFVLITYLSAQFVIPVQPVPFTLQSTVVLLSGLFLGAKNAFYSHIIYLFLGVIGLPVFANVPGLEQGFYRLSGPTGGYLLSFPLVAVIVGSLIGEKQGFLRLTAIFLLGEFLILLFGVLYLNAFFIKDILKSVYVGAEILGLWTIAKILFGAGFTTVVNSFIKFNSTIKADE